MNFFVVNARSRYHPYGPKYSSTLTSKAYSASKYFKSFSEPLVMTKGVQTPVKSEWEWDELRLTSDQNAVFNKLVDRVKTVSLSYFSRVTDYIVV
ncbi:hypothetical protein PAEPH01_2953 [Pancytospora epiphaga]|nr:hypothetical protein PAEPH01_2953 [Pancytospora epiphaga]